MNLVEVLAMLLEGIVTETQSHRAFLDVFLPLLFPFLCNLFGRLSRRSLCQTPGRSTVRTPAARTGLEFGATKWSISATILTSSTCADAIFHNFPLLL